MCLVLSVACQRSFPQQPLYFLVNPKDSFPLTAKSKKYHPFPIPVKAKRVSSLVSSSPRRIRVFLLQSANFQAESPVQFSLS